MSLQARRKQASCSVAEAGPTSPSIAASRSAAGTGRMVTRSPSSNINGNQ